MLKSLTVLVLATLFSANASAVTGAPTIPFQQERGRPTAPKKGGVQDRGPYADYYAMVPAHGYLSGVTVQAPKCPRGAACDPMSVATVTFTTTCVNELSPVTSRVEHRDGKVHVYVSALELVNKNARVVLCSSARLTSVDISLGMGFYSAEEVELHMLQ